MNHSPWTPDEDNQLIELHRQFGNSWVRISALMRNRSDNAVKNRWNATLRKQEETGTKPWEQVQPELAEEAAETTTSQTPPSSSPFVALQAPMSFFTPVINGGRDNQNAKKEERSLEENRTELLRLMLD
jgi:hypothetical protein